MGSSSSNSNTTNSGSSGRAQYATWVTPDNETQYIAPLEDEHQIEKLKDKPKASILKIKSLINGYIREIQQSLKKNKIIPDDIYLLCLHFYNTNTINLLWKLNRRNNPQNAEDIQLRQYGMIDIDDKKSITINLTKFATFKDKE